MEWNQRLAAVRKAAGLTQEQLGDLVGVTRQAVSKWEAAQTVPDALMIAEICRALQVSADYILLGREPEEDCCGETLPQLPNTCPCCGREVPGSICSVCGYTLTAVPPRGPRYALVGTPLFSFQAETVTEDLVKYCGMTKEDANEIVARMGDPTGSGTRFLLRRGLTDSAVQWIVGHIRQDYSTLRIVEDGGEDDALLLKPTAIELPAKDNSQGLGFWGTVGAVILGMIIALLLLSLF